MTTDGRIGCSQSSAGISCPAVTADWYTAWTFASFADESNSAQCEPRRIRDKSGESCVAIVDLFGRSDSFPDSQIKAQEER